MLSDREHPAPANRPVKFVLGPYGYRWLRRRDEPFGGIVEAKAE